MLICKIVKRVKNLLKVNGSLYKSLKKEDKFEDKFKLISKRNVIYKRFKIAKSRSNYQ
jgi:hypothetical protein